MQRHPLILVIEDEESIRENLVEILASMGFNTAEAADGLQGLEKIKTLKPDLVLSDWLMPNMEGIELLKIKEKDSAIASIPFIFLTAKADNESIKQALVNGADGYLTKPYSIRELLQVITARLEKHASMLAEANSKANKKLKDTGRLIENEYGNMLNNALANVQFLGSLAPAIEGTEEFLDLKVSLFKGAMMLPKITKLLENETLPPDENLR